MKQIPLENWAPIPDDPRHIQYTGPRTAQEVFQELRQRLESTGLLPEDSFALDTEWENGREIPKDADIFCTTDYGESEGVYLDVYLKWHEENKPITKSFITGKTLGETGTDLDRMFLISSAITKAFHGDGGSHARYMRLGAAPEPDGAIVHLTGAEQRILMDALVERRNQLLENTIGVEQVLRRMAGSVTEYVNEVGQRPLRISDYDKAALAIQDGALEVFRETYPKAAEQTGALLTQAAARPGMVGRQMCALLLDEAKELPGELYLDACKKAVDTADLERVKLFTGKLEHCVKDPAPSLYGELISHAYGADQRHISDALIRQAAPEQIAAAPSIALYLPAMQGDFRTALALVEKGIDANEHAGQILHTLYANHNGWMAEHFLERGMKIDNENFDALHACIKNGGLKGGQLLLDRGMDFERYQRLAERYHLSTDGHDDTLQALSEHWAQRQAGQEQGGGQEAGGMTLG